MRHLSRLEFTAPVVRSNSWESAKGTKVVFCPFDKVAQHRRLPMAVPRVVILGYFFFSAFIFRDIEVTEKTASVFHCILLSRTRKKGRKPFSTFRTLSHTKKGKITPKRRKIGEHGGRGCDKGDK
jgi:hypothetical protein